MAAAPLPPHAERGRGGPGVTAPRSPRPRDATAEMVDAIRADLDARQIPCPKCGVPMVSARAWAYGTGAFIGVACRPCDTVYHVGEDGDGC